MSIQPVCPIRLLRTMPLAVLLATATAMAPWRAAAHGGASFDASALSALPIAVSVAAPVAIVSGGALLTVVAVEAASEGAVWVLERASDGARAGVRLSAQAAGGLSVAAGTVIVVTAVSTGCVLSAAGRAIAFVPNAIGKALLYNEQVTR